MRRRRLGSLTLVTVAALALVGRALAHGGGVRSVATDSISVPTWLFLTTGGGVVGASFLLASFVTDRAFVARLDDWRGPSVSVGRIGRGAGKLLGLLGLTLVLASGLTAGSLTPTDPVRNAATLLVWVGWWGLFVTLSYLLGNAWPAVDPFRTVAALVPSLDYDYPEWLGSWPAVVGLLALVYVEVVTPLADDPRLLAGVVGSYGLLTLVGATRFGSEWFRQADPLSRLTAAYGRIAPVRRDADGSLTLRIPGSGATSASWIDGRDDVALIVAIVFVTTYDGFVGTDLWQAIARPFVLAGVTPTLLYAGLLLVGFAGFYATMLLAGWLARQTTETFLTSGALVRRFTPSLLAIAAGYHFAHSIGTTLALLPTLVTTVVSPFAPPQEPLTLAVPGWFGGVGIAAVLAGHLLAIWMAHTTAYELFPDRLQAIKSQYGITAVMVLFTMIALWIVTTPGGAPPYV